MEDKEFTERYTIHRMAEQEIVAAFDCGDEDLNGFILTDAPLYRKEKLAVTYTVFEKSNHNHIVAFFSLSNDRISISDFDSKTKYNRFSRRFNNHKRLKSYPAAKIGRLGVSESLKGMNIGSMLLKFIKLYFTTDNKTGCRFITVDAYAAAIPFYLRNGFVPLNEEDADEPTRLLYFDLNDRRGCRRTHAVALLRPQRLGRRLTATPTLFTSQSIQSNHTKRITTHAPLPPHTPHSRHRPDDDSERP